MTNNSCKCLSSARPWTGATQVIPPNTWEAGIIPYDSFIEL